MSSAPLTLVGSVLWANVVYVLCSWYVLGSKLRAHTRGPSENPSTRLSVFAMMCFGNCGFTIDFMQLYLEAQSSDNLVNVLVRPILAL